MYHLTRLPSGLRIATSSMPHMASISLGLWVGVGGRYEPAELNGVSHFIEHMLFKGTRKRSAKRISQDIEGIGGYSNAFTSEENTCFYAKAGNDHFPELLDVLMDMMLHSRFDPHEISKEREVIKEELAMYLDQPQQHVQELLNEMQWPHQPLGRSITGTEATLDAMDRRGLVGFLRNNYRAANSLVVAAGNLRHADIVKAASAYEPHFSRGCPAKFVPASMDQERPRLRLSSKPIEQTQMALGMRTCSRHDERRFALRLFNIILGENSSSRLFQAVREENGLAYSISSSLSFFEDVGDLVIAAGLESDKLESTLRLVLHELRRLAGKAPTPAEVRQAKEYVFGQIDLSLENTENHMLWLGEQLLGYGSVVSADAVKQRLDRVTPRDIHAVVRDFFQADRLNLALVGPRKSATGLARLLVP